MLSKILSFFENQSINIGKTKILVAASGGVDSVVLCYIFSELGIDFGMAHCNFKLRGEASNDDADFVEELATYLNAPFYKKEFDTKKLLEDSKESTQSLARKLRYDWFDELVNENEYDFLATAHHFNDVVETMLFNQARGTGVRGMRGILAKNGTTIRPLLACTKAEILTLATENEIHYAEDASNETDDYQRNFIRHQIMPLFEKVNPSFLEAQTKNRQYLLDLETILNGQVQHIKNEYCSEDKDIYTIDYQKIETLPAVNTLTFELLHPFGFNSDQVQQIQSTFPTNGKIFCSNSHELLIHQQQFLIRAIRTKAEQNILVHKMDKIVELKDQSIQLDILSEQPTDLGSDSNTAYFDMDKLQFPIKVRNWKSGDTFQPFGMKGKKKKIQDLFSDQKMSLFQKEQTWLLESDGKIVWVIGMRTDELAKITSKTTRILKMSVIS